MIQGRNSGKLAGLGELSTSIRSLRCLEKDTALNLQLHKTSFAHVVDDFVGQLQELGQDYARYGQHRG